jgi:hypothetical protein
LEAGAGSRHPKIKSLEDGAGLRARHAETYLKMAANLNKSTVFQCQQCGDCCTGRGGIFVRPHEVEAMAALLALSVAEFSRRFVEPSPMGPRLTVADGVCVFLLAKGLCRVHPVKPSICRQWPFLPALLIDPDELEYAKGA